jgi:hypothetical protein
MDTPIAQLGLSSRAINALDRIDVLTAQELWRTPKRYLNRLRGVGNQTRREILQAVTVLQTHWDNANLGESMALDTNEGDESQFSDTRLLSVDLLAQKLLKPKGKQDQELSKQLETILLSESPPGLTPGDGAIAEDRQAGLGKLQRRWLRDPQVASLRTEIQAILASAGGIMAAAELTDAILIARGSIYDEPQRSRLATAILRAAILTEQGTKSPQFQVYERENRFLLAPNEAFADYGFQLGDWADELAQADPLLSPQRVQAQLREVAPPPGFEPLTDDRLMRLAAAASCQAAVSSRLELYPRGMDAKRAVILSQGALYGLTTLTLEQIRDRVASRYPDAQPLPPRPRLDGLLAATSLALNWNALKGCYENSSRASSLSSSAYSLSRLPGPWPEEAAVSLPAWEQRLERSLKAGAYQVLMVKPRLYERAYQQLTSRFGVALVDLEGIFIESLRTVVQQAGANWQLVVETDAHPHQGDWDKLMVLVQRVMPLVEAQLRNIDRPMLMIYPGLLARYHQMTLFDRLRQAIAKPQGIQGLWVLVPGDREALIDGKAVPVLSAAEKMRIPEAWLDG